MSLSAAEIQIVLRARDEASTVLRQAEDGTASLGRSIERSLERWAQASLASQRKGPPYIVGEEGPTLFVPHAPAGKPRTDIDYESMAKAIARALKSMPPPTAPIR